MTAEEPSHAAPVVVGVDGSAVGRDALRWAHAEARRHNAPLEVIHAWRQPVLRMPEDYPPHLVGAGRLDDAAAHLVRAQLRAVGLEEGGTDGPPVIVSTYHGSPASALVEASRRAVLTVVGRHGTTAIHPLGGVTDQVVHHAAGPVAVVPPADDRRGTGVIVGIDGSHGAIDAVRWAYQEALRRHCEIGAVYAWSWLDQTSGEAGSDTTKFDPGFSANDAEQRLDRWLYVALGDGARRVHSRVVNDLPAQALLDAALSAELVVVGSRGMGGFKGLLLGSVSRRVVEHAASPIVVVHRG